MRVKTLIWLILPWVALVAATAIAVIYAMRFQRDAAVKKPVGTPRTHTTFIEAAVTASGPSFGGTSVPSRWPSCAERPRPVGGMWVVQMPMGQAYDGLYRTDINGNALCWLTDHRVASQEPAISPDGQKVAFRSFDTQFRPGIYAMKIDGTGRQLVVSGGSEYSYPGWSPDGSHLVFQATLDELFDIYSSRSDGTDLRNLTSDIALDTMPAWSPDGKHIAFISDRTFDPNGYVQQGDSFELYVMDTDGTHVQRLTTNERSEMSPTWSPDSRRIAFVYDHHLTMINVDGTDLNPITHSSSEYIYSPVWLGSGKEIIYLAYSISTQLETLVSVDLRDMTIQPLAQSVPYDDVDVWGP